jgi:hypothetical protein
MDMVINAYHTFVRKTRFGNRYFIITKDKPNEPNKLKMIAMMIGFWILTWIRSSMPTIPLKIKNLD